jgi:alpha-tubulin suppressor-like RCC1 family protein
MRQTLSLALLFLLVGACTERTPVEPEPEPTAQWSDVGAGTYFSCGTTADHRPHCWGFYSAAPGSGGEFAITGVPVPVPGAVPLRQVRVGGGIGCGLDEQDRAFCWGREHFGELGNGGSFSDSTRVPVPVAGGLTFSTLSVGYGHACGITPAGEAFCWGGNFNGELGIGVMGAGAHQRAAPARVVGDLVFLSISAGTTHTCGVTVDGAGYCWGGGYGAVGVPHLDPARCPPNSPCSEPRPQRVAAELRFTSISAGNGFTCGVTQSGAGYCWGGLFEPMLRHGVLGSGSTAGSATPVPVAGGIRFAVIETGTRAACGLDVAGVAYCWGGNSLGELGVGVADSRAHPLPEAVRTSVRFQKLSLGDVSCGLATDAALYCWGTTAAGMLGNGQTQPGVRTTPTRVVDPLGR